MKKLDLKSLIHELEIKKERKEEEYRQLRDDMYEAQGALGELEVLLYRLKYE